MKKIKNLKIKDVIYFGEYRLFLTEEKEEKGTMYHSYLQNISCGIISSLFGYPKKSVKFEEFKKICLNCLDEYTKFEEFKKLCLNCLDEYIKGYQEEYE